MLSRKVERIVLIIIFFTVLCIIGSFATKIKANELPINVGVTPEKLIESKFNEIAIRNLDYKYIVKGNYMFFAIDGIREKNRALTGKAFRNEHSGFIFDLPGFVFGFGYNTKTEFIQLPNNASALLSISKINSDILLEIDDDKKNNIEYFVNDKKMDLLTFNDVEDSTWVGVITNLTDNTEIYGMDNGKKFHVIDSKDIKSYYGG